MVKRRSYARRRRLSRLRRFCIPSPVRRQMRLARQRVLTEQCISGYTHPTVSDVSRGRIIPKEFNGQEGQPTCPDLDHDLKGDASDG